MKKEKLPKIQPHLSPKDEEDWSNFTVKLRWVQSKGEGDQSNQKEKETGEIKFLPLTQLLHCSLDVSQR